MRVFWLLALCSGLVGQTSGTDREGNRYRLELTAVLDLPTGADALQRRGTGGWCVVTTKPGTLEPCQDYYLSKMAPDGKTLLTATYLGGDGQENAGRLGVTADGELVVAMHRGDGTDVVLRLDRNLRRAEAERRLEQGVDRISLSGRRIGLAGVSPEGLYSAELDWTTLTELRRTALPATRGSQLGALEWQSNGRLLLGWWSPGGAAEVAAVDAAGVAWRQQLAVGLRVVALGDLPGNGLAVFGNLGQTGFVQRLSADGRVLEAGLRPGTRIALGRTLGNGMMQWIGVAESGLETSVDAPLRCKPARHGDYFAEMSYAVGEPGFVSYLEEPRHLADWWEISLPQRVTETRGACLDAGLETLAAGEIVLLRGAGWAGTPVVRLGQRRGAVLRANAREMLVALPFGLGGQSEADLELEAADGRAVRQRVAVIAARPVVVGVVIGRVVSIYLTGCGELEQAVEPDAILEAPGVGLASTVRAAVLDVGEQQVLYAGTVEGQIPGLTQINVKLDDGLSLGTDRVLRISIGGALVDVSLRQSL